jgi:hypothetical protein
MIRQTRPPLSSGPATTFSLVSVGRIRSRTTSTSNNSLVVGSSPVFNGLPAGIGADLSIATHFFEGSLPGWGFNERRAIRSTRDFFDPTPEQQNVVLIDSATLQKAQRRIAGCEGYSEGAEIPFDNILDRLTGSDLSITDYVLEVPARLCGAASAITSLNRRINRIW